MNKKTRQLKIRNKAGKTSLGQSKFNSDTWPDRIKDRAMLFSFMTITVITFIIYLPILNNKFLNWDDNLYVTGNSNIQSLNYSHIKAFFTQTYVSNYLPLTMLSYAFDYKVAGLDPKAYTITNLILHIINSLLVFLLIIMLVRSMNLFTNNIFKDKSGLRIGLICSLLFAVHPINVESVAWISERKNLLYSFFFLLSLVSYLEYLKKDRALWYIIALILFVCSLLSKGVAVSLSLCLLAIDFLLKRNLLSRKVVMEKIPFFILSIVFGILTILAQKNENVLVGAVNFPFHVQLSFASYGLVNYLLKLLIPFNLSAYYSYPLGASSIHWLCLAIVFSLMVLLFIYRMRLSRLILFSVLFYMANIIFLIQIIPVGNAIMADRYIYISSIGFFLIIAVLIVQNIDKPLIVSTLAAAIILLYSVFSHNRLEVWNNSLVFWDDVIKKDKHIPRAWNNRGIVRNEEGDFSGALNDFNNAISLMPGYQEAYNNRGIVYYNLKKNTEAIADFSMAIRFDSLYSDAFYNRGTVRYSSNELQGALSDLNNSIRLNPGKLEAYLNRANVKIAMNDNLGALRDCENILNRNRNYWKTYPIMASANYNLGKYSESIEEYSKAIAYEPGNINYYHNRGAAFYYSGKYTEAINDMNTVLQNKAISISYYIRGMANIKIGKATEGCEDLYKALNGGVSSVQADINSYCKK